MNRTNNTPAIKFGVVAGLVFAALCFGCHAAGMNVFASFLIWYTWLPVIFLLFLIGAFVKRRQLEGYMTFKEALAFAFLAYVIYEVFYAIVTVVLFRVVDPQLQDKVVRNIMENTRQFMEKMGANESTVEDAMKKAQQSNQESYSVKQIFLGFGTSIVYDFIKSIIIAAVTQRNKSQFAETKESNP